MILIISLSRHRELAASVPKKAKKRTRRNRDARPYRRHHDGKWVAVAYYSNGKRKPCYGDSAEEAEEKRRQFYREIENQQPVTVGRTDTLGQYLTRSWLAVTLPQRVQAGRLAESTLDSYRDMVARHLLPELGRVRLVDLSTMHVRAWLLKLSKTDSARRRRQLRPGEEKLPAPTKLSPRTVAYCHAILRKALADAVDDELIVRNVCLLVDAPTVPRKAVRELTRGEVRRLLDAAAGDRLWAFWIVVLALGLRRGEGLGLRWEDVDLEAGTVGLGLSVQRLRGDKDPETGRHRGRLVAKHLKTDASKATMTLPAFATAALREHHTAQLAEREQARVWADDGLVFATTVGTPLEPRRINRLWAELCDRAEVERCRVHDLRHACATFLFADGVDLKVIQGWLRHTRLATTSEIYVHLLEEVRALPAKSMNDVFVDLGAERAKRAR